MISQLDVHVHEKLLQYRDVTCHVFGFELRSKRAHKRVHSKAAQKYFDKLFLMAFYLLLVLLVFLIVIGVLQLERKEFFRVELRVRDQQSTLTL